MKSSISRIGTFILSGLLPFLGFGQHVLFIPDTLSGSVIDLNLRKGQVEFYPGFSTNTIGYNQEILGPTLILEKGNHVTLNVTNSLEEPTTLHWHGLHVSSKNDGGPHTVIEANQTWSPFFMVLDNASTYWYHPHLHEHTEAQVTKGAAGLIIVRDEVEAKLNLPRSYGVDDFPIIIQSRAFDENKQFVTNTAKDEFILCNGTLEPFLNVPAQIVRLRLLNGSTERVYNLGLEGNVVFFQIGTDGGLLVEPIPLNRLQLAPGERAQILLDLTKLEGQATSLMSYGSELQNGIYGSKNPSAMPGGMMQGAIDGYNSNPLNGNDFSVLQFNVIQATTHAVTEIPSALAQITRYSEDDVDMTRRLFFRPARMGPTGMLNGPFSINNASFNKAVINYEVPLNNVEIWELTNMTAIAHPFHIHDVQFNILDINGAPPPANLKGRKDVVLVPPMFGTVRFIAKFEDFADEEIPYMYHCHMLSHEDDGMMGQFVVYRQTTAIEGFNRDKVRVFPNPTRGLITVNGHDSTPAFLLDYTGKSLNLRVVGEGILDLSGLPSGIYFLKVLDPEGVQVLKIIKGDSP